MTGTDDTDGPSSPAPRPRAGGGDRARDEMIADIDMRLRRYVQTSGDRLSTVEATVSESAGLLAETLPRVDDLAEGMAELTGRLDEIAGAPGGREAAVVPVCWPALTTQEAEHEWRRLADWVATVLGPWYRVRRRQIPDCWALHRGVVLHLSWLHSAYLAAHTGSSATPTLSAEWHVRWLPAALDACLREAPDYQERASEVWANECRPGYHLDPTPREHRPSDQYTDQCPTGAPTRLADQLIEPRFWDHFWQQAVADDLAWRHARDVGQPPAPG